MENLQTCIYDIISKQTEWKKHLMFSLFQKKIKKFPFNYTIVVERHHPLAILNTLNCLPQIRRELKSPPYTSITWADYLPNYEDSRRN